MKLFLEECFTSLIKISNSKSVKTFHCAQILFKVLEAMNTIFKKWLLGLFPFSKMKVTAHFDIRIMSFNAVD